MRPEPENLDEVWMRLLVEPMPEGCTTWTRSPCTNKERVIAEMRSAFNYYFPTFDELKQLVCLEVYYKSVVQLIPQLEAFEEVSNAHHMCHPEGEEKDLSPYDHRVMYWNPIFTGCHVKLSLEQAAYQAGTLGPRYWSSLPGGTMY